MVAEHLERDAARPSAVSCTPLYGSCETRSSSQSLRTMPDAEAAVTPMRSAIAVVVTVPVAARLEGVDRLRVVLDGGRDLWVTHWHDSDYGMPNS